MRAYAAAMSAWNSSRATGDASALASKASWVAPTLQRRVAWVARGGAVVSVGVSLTVLLGWLLDAALLTTFAPGLVSTKLNAAAALAAGGVGFLAGRSHRPVLRATGQALGMFAVIIGGLTLAQYIAGVDLGIDRALVRDRASTGSLGAVMSGRMAPTTAVGLLCCGVAVALGRRGDRLRGNLGGLVVALAASVLIEHILGVDFINSELWASTAMALPTTLALLGLGLAIVLGAGDGGFVALLPADTAGGYMARRFGLACLFGPLLVALTARLGYMGGLYSAYERLAVVVIGSAFVFYGLVVWSSRRLHTLDLQRLANRRDLRGRDADLARALERERELRERADEDARVNRTLRRLATSFSSELDERRLVQQVVDEAAALTQADFGALFFNGTDDSGEVYTLYALSGAPREAFERFPLPRATPLFGPTFRGEGPIRLSDVREDPRFGAWGPQPRGHPDVVSYLAVPVVTRGGDVLGGLFFAHHLAGRFTAEHEKLVVELAGQAATALENARLYRALRDSEARARDADRRKDDFLAMLGHELRNPLAPITTALGLVHERGHTPAAWAVVERQVGHLHRLVEDLIDLSKVTRGMVELDRKVVEVSSIVADAVESVSMIVERRRHRLTVEVEEGLLVDADAHRLVQVLVNLLENAAKYTDEGGNIAVAARREDEQVLLCVQDDGRGIESGRLCELFDPFMQGPRPLDRTEGGMGIGLSIVRSLVELHGGTIRAHSEGPGRGSRFEVRLDAHGTGAKPHPDPRADRQRDELHATEVVVVDDNRDAVEMLAMLLESWGCKVHVAYDGLSALRLVEDVSPSVALLDIGLPEMDGYELARRIRQRWGDEIRLIAVTGYGQQSDRDRAREAGFDEHLVKPVDTSRLRRSIDA